MQFAYPSIPRLQPDLLLITHEHFDHSAQEALAAPKFVIRSTAGRFETPIGEVVAIASEHDPVAGTQRGPNAIFVFSLDGMRVCHFGDFGQRTLRPEQAAAIGKVDLLLLPVGGGPTIGADAAYALCGELSADFVLPMHYRTPAINFLETADAFLAYFSDVAHVDRAFDTQALPAGTRCVVPAPPVA